MTGSYNSKHPKGNKFTINELKTIRNEFYEKAKSLPKNFDGNNSLVAENGTSAQNVDINISVNLWHDFSENLERYQQAIDYAYGCWTGNFKRKYPRIHVTEDSFGNADYQALQDEIDKYGDNLYREFFENISRDYSESKQALAESITMLSIELSKRLYDFLCEYLNAMTFHYQSDGHVGVIDYYWSSFFVCLDKN